MHDYVKTLGMVTRRTREEQGMFQASPTERLGIDIRTIINIENFRGNPKFEMLYPLVTTLRVPTDRTFYPEIDPAGNNKQQLFWRFHSLSEKEALELLLVVHCLTEVMRKHGPKSP